MLGEYPLRSQPAITFSGALQPFKTDDRHGEELPRRANVLSAYRFAGAFRLFNFRF